MRRVGIMLLVYIKKDLLMYVSEIESDYTDTGLRGMKVSQLIYDKVSI